MFQWHGNHYVNDRYMPLCSLWWIPIKQQDGHCSPSDSNKCMCICYANVCILLPPRLILHVAVLRLSNVHTCPLFPYESHLCNNQLLLHHNKHPNPGQKKQSTSTLCTFPCSPILSVSKHSVGDGKASEMINQIMKEICTGPAPNLSIHTSAFKKKGKGLCCLCFGMCLFLWSSLKEKATAVHLVLPAPLLAPFQSARLPRQRRN